jgi:hypothetical protein
MNIGVTNPAEENLNLDIGRRRIAPFKTERQQWRVVVMGGIANSLLHKMLLVLIKNETVINGKKQLPFMVNQTRAETFCIATFFLHYATEFLMTAIYIRIPLIGSTGGGRLVSPSCCRKSISTVRHRADIGVSLMRFSNGSRSSAPNRSIVTNMKASRVSVTNLNISSYPHYTTTLYTIFNNVSFNSSEKSSFPTSTKHLVQSAFERLSLVACRKIIIDINLMLSVHPKHITE